MQSLPSPDLLGPSNSRIRPTVGQAKVDPTRRGLDATRLPADELTGGVGEIAVTLICGDHW